MKSLRLVSVHIPKTAGTTLSSVLRQKYGVRFFHERQIFNDTQYKSKSEEIWRRARRKISARVCTAIHGHFPASKYSYESGDLITFVRDPVDRRVSFWRYVNREFEKARFIRDEEWAKALSCDLEEFVGLPDNCFSRFLDVPLESFSFIGTVSDFDSDMKYLSKIIGCEYKPIKKNVAPTKLCENDNLRRNYLEANEDEMALYEAALARRAQILDYRFGVRV